MDIRKKSPAELLNQLASLEPSMFTLGLEVDDEFSACNHNLSTKIPLAVGLGEPPELVQLGSNEKFLFGKIILNLATAQLRGRKPLSAILEMALADPENQHYIGGRGHPDAYGYTGAVREVKAVMNTSFTNIRTEAEKRPLAHPEWLNPEMNGLVLNTHPARAQDLFPGGNYLYHASTVNRIEDILHKGNLFSLLGLAQRYSKPSVLKTSNGGDSAISWNYNDVNAMPGSLGHLAGFLTSPEALLSRPGNLFVPVEAGKNELQYIGGTLDVEQYKELRSQLLVWSRIFKEGAKLFVEHQPFQAVMPPSNLSNSMSQLAKGRLAEEDIDKLFWFSDGLTRFDALLLDGSLSPLLVLIRSVIAGGDASEICGRPISSVLELSTRELYKLIDIALGQLVQDEVQPLFNQLNELTRPANSKTFVPVKNMVFVCSDSDLKLVWQHVFAHSPEPPQAVLTFDHKRARVPNFVLEKGLGDHSQIAEAIRAVIPRTTDTIEWQALIGGEAKHKKDAARHLVETAQTLSAYKLTFDGKKLKAS